MLRAGLGKGGPLRLVGVTGSPAELSLDMLALLLVLPVDEMSRRCRAAVAAAEAGVARLAVMWEVVAEADVALYVLCRPHAGVLQCLFLQLL